LSAEKFGIFLPNELRSVSFGKINEHGFLLNLG
jgi:hypothetical protein